MLKITTLYIALTLLSLLIYYSISKKFRLLVLLIASIVFISILSLKAFFFALLLTILNYLFGILLEKLKERQVIKIKLFWLFILIDIGILFISKSLNSLIETIIPSFSFIIIDSVSTYDYILIPLGISYYLFQALGYIIRINRGVEKAEHNFIKFATYLLFFPKFLSGPVVRSNHFFPEINHPVAFNWNNIYQGGRLFLWGLFKKVVIANNLQQMVLLVYGNVSDYSGVTLIYVLLIQALYIYFDFSGYTDMAMGTAKLFGIKIMDNFNRPFLARSVTDYWRRWHISLSSWCNDFIYYPFIVKFRRFENTAIISGIFLTFFIVGIWHGMNWTFVVLGILQGVAIVYENYSKKYRFKLASKLPFGLVKATSRIIVYLFISISLVFFFARNLSDALYFLTHLFSFKLNPSFPPEFLIHKVEIIFSLCCIVVLIFIETKYEKGKNVLAEYLKLPFWAQWAGYIICIGLITLFYSDINSFYYMRF